MTEEQAADPSRCLECVRFAVDVTPYACWEWDVRGRNLEFLRGIDPGYYQYVADANAEHLDDDEHKHNAALAIRMGYSQALETFFALLGALLQAPECAYGWLMRYRVVELRRLVEKVRYEREVLTIHDFARYPSWKKLSDGILQFLGHDDEKKAWITEGFAKAWGRFSGDFLNAKVTDEYNCAKHGLRGRLGGVRLSYGKQDGPSQPTKPEAMKTIGGSDFGSSFFTCEPLQKEGKSNFRARRLSRNWVPENFINALHLLSMSISNVVSTLRIVNGEDPGKCLFHNPDRPEAFDTPWSLSCGLTDANMDRILTADQVEPKTKQEILDVYKHSM